MRQQLGYFLRPCWVWPFLLCGLSGAYLLLHHRTRERVYQKPQILDSWVKPPHLVRHKMFFVAKGQELRARQGSGRLRAMANFAQDLFEWVDVRLKHGCQRFSSTAGTTTAATTTAATTTTNTTSTSASTTTSSLLLLRRRLLLLRNYSLLLTVIVNTSSNTTD